MTTIKAIWFFLTNWPRLKAWFEKLLNVMDRPS
jgi:hypothetical protein